MAKMLTVTTKQTHHHREQSYGWSAGLADANYYIENG